MERPAGRPVADQSDAVATGELSVAEFASGAIADPDTSPWSPGEVTFTLLVIVHVNDVEPEAPEPSVAVRVTEEVPAVVGVPEMVPVDGSMVRPAGRPVADHVSVAAGEVSVAGIGDRRDGRTRDVRLVGRGCGRHRVGDRPRERGGAGGPRAVGGRQGHRAGARRGGRARDGACRRIDGQARPADRWPTTSTWRSTSCRRPHWRVGRWPCPTGPTGCRGRHRHRVGDRPA